ncbi:MAG: hypothetical protein QW282_06300 [Nitrososphaerales archaeon]
MSGELGKQPTSRSEQADVEYVVVQQGSPAQVTQPSESKQVQTTTPPESEETQPSTPLEVKEALEVVEGSVEGHPLWSFGETLKEKAVEKARAAEEARSIFSARRDLPTLYGYVAALEQRIEVLERLIELLKRR